LSLSWKNKKEQDRKLPQSEVLEMLLGNNSKKSNLLNITRKSMITLVNVLNMVKKKYHNRHTNTGIHGNFSLTLSDFNKTWTFLTVYIFTEFHSAGAEIFLAEMRSVGRTDRQLYRYEKSNSFFFFANFVTYEKYVSSSPKYCYWQWKYCYWQCEADKEYFIEILKVLLKYKLERKG
jgi:hypothetical protein